MACSGDDTAPTTAAISPAASATAVGSTTVQPTDAAGSGSTTSTPRSSSSDQPPPPPAQEASIDWPLPGRDLDNSRAAIGSRIDSTDIARLQPAWEVELGGQLTTAPIVRDGVVYVADGAGGITAIELDSGDVVWASDPTGSNIGPFGVAVDDDRVYAARRLRRASSPSTATPATRGVVDRRHRHRQRRASTSSRSSSTAWCW